MLRTGTGTDTDTDNAGWGDVGSHESTPEGDAISIGDEIGRPKECEAVGVFGSVSEGALVTWVGVRMTCDALGFGWASEVSLVGAAKRPAGLDSDATEPGKS